MHYPSFVEVPLIDIDYADELALRHMWSSMAI